MDCMKATPEPRKLFTDGVNSLAHVALGFALGARFLVPFMVYQYVLKPDHNSTVDTAEYFAGWFMRDKLKGTH